MSVLKSSIKMAIATFISRILGLVREQVMAAYFGASGVTDAFLVAYRIPNLLRDLFAEGAFSSAFVPTFVEVNQESREKSRELMWSLFWLLLFITGLISLGIIIFAPEIIQVFAPAFKDQPEKFEITVNLTRIMGPFLTFVSLAALFMGVLNSLKVFFVPAVAPAFYNIMSILGMLFLSGILTSWGYHPIYSLGVGALFGGIMQCLVQLPLILKHGLRPLWPNQFWTEKSKKVFKLLGPGLVGFAATQINLLVVTILATGTLQGAVSWLNYAFRLFQLPVGILSVSIGNSNMVHFSEAWKSGKVNEAKKVLESSYFLSFLTVMPALAILYVLSNPIINLIFERGKFSANDTLMTAKALQMYALGLPFYGLYKIWVPTFYALDRQKIPVIGSFLSIAFNIAFCMLLTPHYGFKILALGTTLSVTVNAVFQTLILKKDLNLSFKFFFPPRLFKILFATFISGFAVQNLFSIDSFQENILMKTFWVFTEILALASIYGFSLIIMGEGNAVKEMMGKFTSKVKRN
jgi:putative peptidoglycan lipid II flippase